MLDYALIGGGLQNGLIALALRRQQPDARLRLFERTDRLGGNHTWCFHQGDLSDAMAEAVQPLVVHRWDSYDVAFPELTRRLDAAYAAVTSERFHEVLSSELGDCIEYGADVVDVAPHHIQLRDGRGWHANAVIDASGPRDQAGAGYQKFAGHELRLAAPHGLPRPVIMDATVPQTDGFRFVYVLPLADDRLLVEDTYFSDTPALDAAAVGREIHHYAAERGWRVAEVLRTEQGVLPLPWSGDVAAVDGGPLRAGYGGGWFHPVTGYSFPVAARLAELVASTPVADLFGPALHRLAADVRRQRRFCHRLNHMLFHWFAPQHRRNVLERFYRLPAPTIARFYALQLTAADRSRILMGRPPRGISWRAVLARGVPT